MHRGPDTAGLQLAKRYRSNATHPAEGESGSILEAFARRATAELALERASKAQALAEVAARVAANAQAEAIAAQEALATLAGSSSTGALEPTPLDPLDDIDPLDGADDPVARSSALSLGGLRVDVRAAGHSGSDDLTPRQKDRRQPQTGELDTKRLKQATLAADVPKGLRRSSSTEHTCDLWSIPTPVASTSTFHDEFDDFENDVYDDPVEIVSNKALASASSFVEGLANIQTLLNYPSCPVVYAQPP